jgi:hypothetical protein
MSDQRPLLDWRPPEPRRLLGNAPFRVSNQVPDWNTEKVVRSKAYRRKAWLDQRREGSCVGFGGAHALSMGRYPVSVTEELARYWYKRTQFHDEWDGEGYEGTSVWGFCHFLHHETDLINAYWWATTMEEFIHGLTQFDPFEVGLWWYTGMFTPDSDGFIHPTGIKEGGHALAVGAYDARRKVFRLDQSWGQDHGVNGSVYMHEEEFAHVFSDQGEAALFRKRRPPKAAA